VGRAHAPRNHHRRADGNRVTCRKRHAHIHIDRGVHRDPLRLSWRCVREIRDRLGEPGERWRPRHLVGTIDPMARPNRIVPPTAALVLECWSRGVVSFPCPTRARTLPELAGPNHPSHRKDDIKVLATNTESSVRGLDLDIAPTLPAGRKSERTLRCIDDDALSTLVWVIDKLVKAYI
jgi:hypothetical protein